MSTNSIHWNMVLNEPNPLWCIHLLCHWTSKLWTCIIWFLKQPICLIKVVFLGNVFRLLQCLVCKSLILFRIDRCDPGVWRYQLKIWHNWYMDFSQLIHGSAKIDTGELSRSSFYKWNTQTQPNYTYWAPSSHLVSVSVMLFGLSSDTICQLDQLPLNISFFLSSDLLRFP